MTQTTVWTIGKLLEWTTGYLAEKGSGSPRLDAEILLSRARNCERIRLYTDFTEEPTEETKVAFREMVRRRAEGTPVAYLVGYKEFYSLSFRVTSDVLIPRPETEHLVIGALDLVKLKIAQGSWQNDRPVDVADVCTGSGCVAISIAKHLPTARLFASDISSAAVEIAQSNVSRHEQLDSISVLQSDLFEHYPKSPKFDIIVSNPPYITATEYAQLDPGVREHEPELALVAGDDGLSVIRDLIIQSADRCHSGGWLLFEMSPMIAEHCEQLIERDANWQLLPTLKDLAGHKRIIVAQRC